MKLPIFPNLILKLNIVLTHRARFASLFLYRPFVVYLQSLNFLLQLPIFGGQGENLCLVLSIFLQHSLQFGINLLSRVNFGLKLGQFALKLSVFDLQ